MKKFLKNTIIITLVMVTTVILSTLSINASADSNAFKYLQKDTYEEVFIENPSLTQFSNMNSKTLTMMSENECLEFITINGISIPNEFINDIEIGAFVKEIITTIVINPDYEFSYNYNVTHEFANNIKNLVNNSLGISEDEFFKDPQMLSRYTLQDSTVIGPWDSSYYNYNCYAFAIGRTEQPPEYSTLFQYQPGDFSGDYFSLSLTISQMAEVVKEDLQTLGYSNITIHNSMPSYQTYDKLIAMRRGTFDYHFMKYDSGDWNHKPGRTAVLHYNYEPTDNRIWTNEYSIYNQSYSGNTTYDSSIYFIGYDLPHTHDYTDHHTWYNYRQHQSFCDCGSSRLMGHVVSSNWNGVGYATCLICNGPAEVGFTQRDGDSFALPFDQNYTIQERFGNGSYILSNGVIVLSNTDLDLFYKGTLLIPSCCNDSN